MNSWDKKILNERMFEYYEGTLSSDKSIELLEVVNQNPEAEAEFAHWAKTYAMKHTDVKEYNLQTALIRQPSSNTKYLKWFSLLILLLGLTYTGIQYINIEKRADKTSESTNQAEIFLKEKKVELEKKNTVDRIKKGIAVYPESPIKNKKYEGNQVRTSLDSLGIAATMVDSGSVAPFIQPPVLMQDSTDLNVSKIQQEIKTPAESKKAHQVKGKKRSALRIQPNQGEILQTNPNF